MKHAVTLLIILVLLLQWLVGWVAGKLNFVGSDYTVIAITQLAAIFLPTTYYIKCSKKEFFSIRLKEKWWLAAPIAVIAIGLNLVCQYANLPVLILLEKLGTTVGSGTIGDTTGGFEIVLTIFFACVVPAFFEELLFRGVALSEYTQMYGKRTAILLTSLIFAWMHFDMAAFVPQLLIGCMSAYLVLRTGTLTWAIWLHLVNNLFSLAIQYRLEVFAALVERHPILVPVGALAVVVLGVGIVRRSCGHTKKRQVISQN